MISNKKLIAAVALAGVFSTGLSQAASLQWVTVGPLPVPVIVPGHVRLPSVIVPPVFVPQVSVQYQAPVPVIYAPVHRHGYGYGYGDRDGDGIPNRYDRVYNPRWDRDGDGIPNWRDRGDRHGRHDRHDERRRHH